jgi:hypothetical protein
MDPTATCCPNEHGPARGQTGRGNIGIHARKEQRFIGPEGDTTFSTTTGTLCYRRRTTAETVVLVVPWLAPGCPVQAIVAALGFAERTVAEWWARSGRQGQTVHESLGAQPRDLGQGPADASRVKRLGGLGWMALAMLGKTRLWLGGEGSAQRDLPSRRRLIGRVRRCAAQRPLLLCPAGLVSSSRAMRETLRASGHTGMGGRPRLRPWRNVLIAQVVKRDECRCVVDPERRSGEGTPARVETLRRRSQGAGGIKTADIERRNAAVPGAGTPDLDTARGCSWWARSRTCVRLTGGSTPARRPRRPWQRGSQTIAGRSRTCCRFRCHCLAGHHRSSAGVHRVHANASLSAGACDHG